MGLSESCEKDGDDGAVLCGDTCEGRDGECDRDMAGELVAVDPAECVLKAYADSELGCLYGW